MPHGNLSCAHNITSVKPFEAVMTGNRFLLKSEKTIEIQREIPPNRRINATRLQVEVLNDWPLHIKPTLSTYPKELKCIQHPIVFDLMKYLNSVDQKIKSIS